MEIVRFLVGLRKWNFQVFLEIPLFCVLVVEGFIKKRMAIAPFFVPLKAQRKQDY